MVLSPISRGGRRVEPGDEVELGAAEFLLLSELGCVEAVSTLSAVHAGEVAIDREAERVRAEAEAEALLVAEAGPTDLLDALDREGLKAFAREHELDGEVSLRLGEDNLRADIRAALDLRAEGDLDDSDPDTEGAERELDDDLGADSAKS